MAKAAETKAERRPVNWRTVAILVAFGSPLWYFATDIMPPPDDAPTITSPEGRTIFRDWMKTFFPILYSNPDGVQK